MKKFFAAVISLAVIAACALPAFAYDDEDFYKNRGLEGTTLNVFNWGESIAEGKDGLIDVNKEFEKLTGITVNYITYQSNEELYAKLKGGGASYDVIIPSDYMLQKLAKEGMLNKLDYSNIPNFANISDEYKGLYFDENNEYSAAYSVGMVGLIYNTKMVEQAPTSWAAMWDEAYSGKILMFDNYRDAFAIGEALLGYSLNTEDEAELAAVAEKLKEQKPLLQSYVMDDVFNKMEKGEAAMAPYYVGDFLSMKEINDDLDFVFPEEGVNIFVDSMCIPSCALNQEAAELYINFMLDPQVALANALSICYATPNKAVLALDEYKEMAESKYLYPDTMPKTEPFYDLSLDTLDTMSGHWDEIKTSGENNIALYIGLAVVGVIIIVVFIAKTVQKKKREA